MFVPMDRLLRRLRPHGDLVRLRARYAAQPGRFGSSGEQRAAARRLVDLKRVLAAEFAATTSCAGCARGEPPPKGRWDGGRCCGTATLVVFTPAEVAALKLAGVRVDRAPAADDEPAGCVFRGPTGCSLAPESRPVVCHVYVCDALRSELQRSPARERIHALRAELHATFEHRACDLPPDRPTALARPAAPGALARPAAPGALARPAAPGAPSRPAAPGAPSTGAAC